MASVLSGLMRFNKNNLSSSIFNGNGAPQTMPKTAPGIVKDLGPDGFWDRNVGKRGPTGPLEQDYSKKQALQKHILSNQTPHVQYINSTHIVVPQRLPNSEDAAVSWLDLAKSVHAGDVVWALRCPPPMVGAQFASNLTKKTQYNYTCSVNLATVNYILFRLQSFFHAFSAICCDPGILESISAGANAAAQEDLYRVQLRQTCIALKEKGPKRFDLWKKWLDFIGEAEEVRLSQLLAWGMEENKDSIKTVAPCFLETWWKEVIVKYEVLEFIKSNANPVGLFIGSDKQGGAHQEESNPATNWPNDYVGTIQLTGKSRRASNIWNRECGFSSGHSLGYKMTRMQVNKNR